MFKDTGDLLLHAAELMRKHSKLKPFVKKCTHILAERLAAVAYVRHSFLEWHNQVPDSEGSGKPLPSCVGEIWGTTRDFILEAHCMSCAFKGIFLSSMQTMMQVEMLLCNVLLFPALCRDLINVCFIVSHSPSASWFSSKQRPHVVPHQHCAIATSNFDPSYC